jgi:glucosamine kinase
MLDNRGDLAPLVIEHVKCQTPLALTLIQKAASEIDRLGSALAAQSKNKSLPCSLLGGLAQFIEPWLGDSLRSRLVRVGFGNWRAAHDPQSGSG